MDMSMQPKAPENDNVIEVNLDGPEATEEVVTKNEDEMDLFNGEALIDEERDEKIAEAFGIEIEEEDKVKAEEKPEETKETETLEEEKEPEEKKEETKEDPEKTINWDDESNPYKEKFNQSMREVNENLLPAKKQRDDLLEEKTNWAKERDEIRGILRSDPELTKKFLEVSETYVPVPSKDPVPAVTNKIDQAEIDKAVEKTIGPEGLRMINEAKEKTAKETDDAIKAFEIAHPGLTKEDRGTLATQTAILQSVLKIPLKDALERSFKATFPERAFEEERKQLEEDARVRAAKRDGAAVTTTGASHSAGSKPAAPQLTAKEVKLAKAFGLTAEEMAAQREE